MEKTPVGVNPHGLTQFINNLGRDCLPDQFLREFVKNSVEAIQKTKEKKGTIVVDANWVNWHFSDKKYLALLVNILNIQTFEKICTCIVHCFHCKSRACALHDQFK